MSAMSERTFSRLFMKDTGFSFRTWKQRARICASLDLLANGIPIKQVAYQLGFSCPAAFTAAFAAFWGNATRLCAINRETLKAVFETAMCILPDAETLRGQGIPPLLLRKVV
nr:HTH-type transcriptional repressor of iron proteins A [Klebsiella pneumoniae]